MPSLSPQSLPARILERYVAEVGVSGTAAVHGTTRDRPGEPLPTSGALRHVSFTVRAVASSVQEAPSPMGGGGGRLSAPVFTVSFCEFARSRVLVVHGDRRPSIPCSGLLRFSFGSVVQCPMAAPTTTLAPSRASLAISAHTSAQCRPDPGSDPTRGACLVAHQAHSEGSA